MAALIITVLTAVFAASGVTWQPVDPASLTQARIVASDALYMFLKPDVPCGPQDRAGCACYVLAWLGTQQGIIDAVLITEGHAVVHVARLTGVRNCAALYCQGYTRFVD